MLISQVIELRPSDRQEAGFRSHAAAARIARNDLLALWREEGQRLKGFRFKTVELRPQVNRVKYAAHPWFRELSQNAVKGGMIDAVDAIERYYRGQNRRPRFLCRNSRPRFRIDNGVGTVKVDGNHLVLPRIGRVRMKEELRWPGKAIRECRIRESGGRWYASVRVEIAEEEYTQHCGSGVLGIDLGLKTFATIAYPDGTIEKVEAPEPLKRSLRCLRRSQRKLARRKMGSRNRAKAKGDVGRRHRRMANIRKDFLHKLSHRITANAHTIQVETLSIKGWQRLWGRKTSDLAPGELLRQLEYKAQWRGGTFLRVDRDFPSSQICHDCGERGGKLGLEVRRWWCSVCGALQDRDANAALNIRDWPGATRPLPVDASGKTFSVKAPAVEAGTESLERQINQGLSRFS